MANSPLFTGIMTALVTPFHKDGSVDFDSYKKLIDAQLEAGVDGLVPCGTTGEASTLSVAEQLEVIRTCVLHVDGRVPIIAGAGANDTKVAVERTRQVMECGVDAVLQVTPWYNKPTQEGLFQHFAAIAATGAKVVLYNVPGRTSVDLLPETAERLADAFENIVAIKEATGSITRAQDLLCRLADKRPDFAVLSGEDTFILGLLAIGGHGVISVVSHLCAAELCEMRDAFFAHDLVKAQAISRKISLLQPTLFFRANPIPTKFALKERGVIAHDGVRLPLVPLPDEDESWLKADLIEKGWL
ncbi:MAG: 4-hydroxy-tetrahydrodipicolinate synthase [Deltaproteobacteria bacterium]|nr:4-hydroxy-tetrahydrodipicolinate synthase [Deltaproteobacteria bacterium]